jgi:hypothetical protein
MYWISDSFGENNRGGTTFVTTIGFFLKQMLFV